MPITDKIVDIQEARNLKERDELIQNWFKISPEQRKRLQEIGNKMFKPRETEE